MAAIKESTLVKYAPVVVTAALTAVVSYVVKLAIKRHRGEHQHGSPREGKVT